MSALTFHIDTAGLLDHSIIIVYVLNTAYVFEPAVEFVVADSFGNEFFPASAVDKHAIGEIECYALISQPEQLLVEVLPYHKSEAEEEWGGCPPG